MNTKSQYFSPQRIDERRPLQAPTGKGGSWVPSTWTRYSLNPLTIPIFRLVNIHWFLFRTFDFGFIWAEKAHFGAGATYSLSFILSDGRKRQPWILTRKSALRLIYADEFRWRLIGLLFLSFRWNYVQENEVFLELRMSQKWLEMAQFEMLIVLLSIIYDCFNSANSIIHNWCGCKMSPFLRLFYCGDHEWQVLSGNIISIPFSNRMSRSIRGAVLVLNIKGVSNWVFFLRNDWWCTELIWMFWH